MKIILSLLFLIAISSRAFAVLNLDAVVKVSSEVCDQTATFPFFGSGTLFVNEGKVYALTSEHAVIHSNQGICHAVQNSRLGKVKARLIRADWAKGLALLQVDGVKEIGSLPTLQIFSDSRAPVGDKVLIAGFPFRAIGLTTNFSGEVMDNQSSRLQLYGVNSSVEIANGHGEFGMSGGPVFSADQTRVYGVLSHQFIKMSYGKPSTIGILGPELGAQENLLMSIPSEISRAWVLQILRNTEPATLLRVSDAQIRGELVVRGSGFVFTAQKDLGLAPIGGQGTGIGGQGTGVGGQGSGIGGQGSGIGGQGSGIGGADEKDQSYRIQVQKDSMTHDLPAEFQDAHLARFARALKSVLLGRDTISIRFFLKRDDRTGVSSRIQIRSLEDFFNKMKDPTLKPILSRIDKGSGPQLFQAQIDVLVPLISKLRKGDRPDSATYLLERMETLIQAVDSTEWQLINPFDIRQLRSPMQRGWSFFADRYFDDYVLLIRALIEIEQKLEAAVLELPR